MDLPPRLELAGIAKRHADRETLRGLDLSLAAGTFAAIIGPSGSGKTTLLKTVNLLSRPEQGSVRIDGRDAKSFALADLRRRIGYVFQGIGLFPHMNVAENIAIVPRLSGMPESERDARVAELLELVALPQYFADRFPSALSGGQAQRVGLARALAAEPALMLMDEPFGALDPITRDELGLAYRALHDRLRLTTLMVTHDVTEALLIADRIIVLIDGRIAADAAPAELLASPGDPRIAAMLAVPRSQAERLAALEQQP